MSRLSSKVMHGIYPSELLDGERNIQLFDSTLLEIITYNHGISNIACLSDLLKHLQTINVSDAIFAFLVESDRISELIVSYYRQELQLQSREIEKRILDNNIKLYENANYIISNDYTENDIERIFGKNIALKFKQAVLIQGRIVPNLAELHQQILIFLFNKNVQIDRMFLKTWLEILFSLWSNAFAGTLNSFEKNMNYLESINDKTEIAHTILKNAVLSHPWISASDISYIFERILNFKDGINYYNIINEVEDLLKSWHDCSDRPWPCDLGKFKNNAFISWMSWCLVKNDGTEDDYLNSAIKLTRKEINRDLLLLVPPIKFEKVISRFMLNNILTALQNHSFIPLKNSGQYLQSKKHLGRFCSYLLTRMPPTPDVIEAIIWTISNYAYNYLKVDRRLHLKSHIRHGARGEPSLHMMKKFYRDHFFHTVEVCFLGHAILLSRPKDRTLKSAFKNSKSIIREWYIASLLHDIGYAVDICNSLKDWLGFFVSDSLLKLSKGITKALEEIKNTDDFINFYQNQGFKNEDKPWEDHGLIGADHLQSLVNDLIKKGRIHRIDKAIEAIAKHNCHNVDIVYENDNLASLLVLCDSLQVWLRPQFTEFSMGPSCLMALLLNRQKYKYPAQKVNANLVTNLSFENIGNKLIPVFNPPLVLRLVYDKEVNFYSYVFNIWLELTCNFQRINFSSLPYEILVQVVTPTYTNPNDRKIEQQMNRLRDVASETHMAYLSNWFPKKEEKGIPQVLEYSHSSCCISNKICYHIEKQDNKPFKEMISFNLKKMDGKKDLITESIYRFRSDLEGWKRYKEDHILTGDYFPWRHRNKPE